MKNRNRSPRVYWVSKKNPEESVLIFDGGYEGGMIHIYRFKESRPSREIEMEYMKTHGKTENELDEIDTDRFMRWWVEKKFGIPLDWDISLSK